ncbi:gluconokinase [Croceitalea sp. MTPC5]|uniref:gluconokinase n=1 Tax=Croceitalea sp. MTPC5 TaxID=3056565 RepID=UPI0030D02AFA
MEKKIFYVMGVSGTGKSTIGTLLSNRLNIPFFDGDDYHPKENIAKMSSGKPLNDDDRKDWLLRLNILAFENSDKGAVIACSALKESYRTLLKKNIEDSVVFIYLKGSFQEVQERLRKRGGHFMPAALLQSQFETLEEPRNAMEISISAPPDVLLETILNQLS